MLSVFLHALLAAINSFYVILVPPPFSHFENPLLKKLLQEPIKKHLPTSSQKPARVSCKTYAGFDQNLHGF